MRIRDMDADDLGALRDLAQSILAGVQALEDLDAHPSWDDEKDVQAILSEARDEMRAMDMSLWGMVDDFRQGQIV